MELIETVELASSASSITFSSIPQTYTDLKILVSARSDASGSTGDVVTIELNSSSANFNWINLRGDGQNDFTSSASSGYTFYTSAGLATADTFGNGSIYISNYTASQNKSISTDGVSETNGTFGFQTLAATLWSNTAAITSVTLSPNAGTNFVTGSTASLYGITAGSDGTTTVS